MISCYKEKYVNNIIEVVAAVIWKDNKFLICQRPAHKKQNPLQWEFPGGKVEQGETKEQALVREIQEELNTIIFVKDTVGEAVHAYPDFSVRITFYNCEIIKGIPEKLEHNDFAWITKADIQKYQFCPADLKMLKIL